MDEITLDSDEVMQLTLLLLRTADLLHTFAVEGADGDRLRGWARVLLERLP